MIRKRELCERVGATLANGDCALSPKERRILELLFLEGPKRTLGEASGLLGKKWYQIRALRNRALRKIGVTISP